MGQRNRGTGDRGTGDRERGYREQENRGQSLNSGKGKQETEKTGKSWRGNRRTGGQKAEG